MGIVSVFMGWFNGFNGFNDTVDIVQRLCLRLCPNSFKTRMS